MEKGIIVVSFGTSYEETRRLTIEAIENRIRDDFDDCLVLRAFTSEIIRKKLRTRDNLYIFNTKEALERMKGENIKDIYIQPLHIIEGHEYEKIVRQSKDFLDENSEYKIKIGKPLLANDSDYMQVVKSLGLRDREDEATIYMGHGSDHEADISYEKLEKYIQDAGYKNTHIATVEGSKTIQDVLGLLGQDIKTINLLPLMLVAGDHAINDMASDEEESWKTILESRGYQVKTELKGLGEIKAIQDIFIGHLKEIYEK